MNIFTRAGGWFRRTPGHVSAPVTNSFPNSTSYPWFGVFEGDELEQGDIFENCTIYQPPDFSKQDSGRPVVRWEKRDLILMSQSCDLVKGRKDITRASLCEVWGRSEFAKIGSPLAKADKLEQVRKGQLPRYHLLADSKLPGYERELRVIDLFEVHSVPIGFLRDEATKVKHLRLLPPYREHLAQSFARVYMRVGLPIDIPKIEK